MAGMEDWGLQAIVRGSSGDFTKVADMDMVEYDQNKGLFPDDDVVLDDPVTHHYRLHHSFHGEFLGSFPDELEDLYKPFYPSAVNNTVPAEAVVELQEQVAHDKLLQGDDHKSDLSSESSAAVCAPKYKRRKNQQKREVIQVSAECLSSDKWAWRKYGQKPIKGSPYPRSYYRCSSSKGCLARKQVEQSCTDPGMYIITYTAEHSHSQPTRRNSLAGTVRQKFPSSKTPSLRQEKPKESRDDAIITFDSVKEKNKEEDEAKLGDFTYDNGDDFMIPDFVLNEDFFSGMAEFEEFVLGPVCHASAQQFPLRSYT